MTAETWHVTLFHHHPDGSATLQAWWVDGQYAADMLARMGPPVAEGLMSVQDVDASIAYGSTMPMLVREEQ